MKLDAPDYRRDGLSVTQVNKIRHVRTIARVAAMLAKTRNDCGTSPPKWTRRMA
jgi:hypothetical protein